LATAKPSDYTARVVLDAQITWLDLVERAGELSTDDCVGPERYAALRAIVQAQEYDRHYDVLRVTTVDARHTALRAGDLLVIRHSGGYYSVIEKAWFVRLTPKHTEIV
jgi:hypothetical protein